MGSTHGSVRRTELTECFSQIYAVHYGSLVRLAALLLDDPGSAEDVVQEAYIRVASRTSRLHEREKALAYVRQTVVNLCRSTLRRRIVARRHESELVHQRVFDDQEYKNVDRHDVVRALRTLPRRQREVLVLRYYYDLSEREVSNITGISIGTVKSHSSRALQSLRLTMEEQ